MTDKEFADWLRNTAAEATDPWERMYEKADEIDPPKRWRAKWPEHAGCMFVAYDGRAWPMTYQGNAGRKLYTGPHKLNMIPHAGSERPIKSGQLVFVRLRNGDHGATFASGLRWVHENTAGDIMYYCPIDPVRVDL